MTNVTGSILINRPPEAVFDIVADERNEPAYNPALISSQLLTGEPIGVGSRFKAVHSSGRGPLEMNVELTEYDAPRRLASVTHTSWADIEGAVTFQPEGASTRMTWSWNVQPKGFAKILTPFVGVIGGRQERACWEGLKHYMERGNDHDCDSE